MVRTDIFRSLAECLVSADYVLSTISGISNTINMIVLKENPAFAEVTLCMNMWKYLR